MTKKAFVATIIWSGLSALSFAQAELSTKITSPTIPPGTWVRPKLTVATTEVAPKIDGDLSDECWKTATKGTGFFRFPTKEEIDQQTEVWVCSNRKSLFVAFHCLESHPELIKASETQRNGNLKQDDQVGLLIDSQNGKRNSSEFWMNPKGTQLQNLEGGSADNQAWQGDWIVVTKMTPDGWIAEIEIPFSLLRYPRGAKQFGMMFARKKASEATYMVWPYCPPEGNGGNIAPYLSDFDGLNLPAYAPKPIISPYSLSTTGNGTSSRFGLDIKYPFSTSFTGLATIKPDFATIEGAVQDVSFSYTEKFVPDRRPFFAENGGFLDDENLFYSQRISDVDYGLKVTGKQGGTSLGFLSTASQIGTRQHANIATFDHELGERAGIGATFMSSHQIGLGGQVMQARGSYGWRKGTYKTSIFANVTESKLDNGKNGKSMFAQMRVNSGIGQIGGRLYYGQVDANFDNPLGLVSDTDSKGGGIVLFSGNLYSKGSVESSEWYFGTESFDRLNGKFFQDGQFAGYEIATRKGIGLGLKANIGKREAFHDQTLSPSLSWNGKSLLSQGRFGIDFGHRQNKAYRFTSVSQGFPVGQRMSFNVNFGQIMLGSEINWQTILSGTYRIDPLQSFGGRMVTQDGKANLYLSYGKKTRQGNDLFILLGDPNSETTKRAITLKLVRTF
jgi:Domain of unknown function (DUF5916)/Carbohydrate family 9 binding domain-like